MWKWQWRSNPNQIETESQTNQRTRKHRIESNRIESKCKMNVCCNFAARRMNNQLVSSSRWTNFKWHHIFRLVPYSRCFPSFFLSVYRHPVVARSLSIRPFRLVGVLFSSNPVLSIITVQFSLFELASVFICSVCLLSMCNVHVQNSQCIIPNV